VSCFKMCRHDSVFFSNMQTCRDETRDELLILVTDYQLRQIVNPENACCHDVLFLHNHHGNWQIYTIRIVSARILPDSEEEENPGSR
jgi:hypothetical protein